MGLKSKMLVMVMVIGALGSAPLMAEAQLGNIIGSLLGVINVQGVVYCTADGNIGTINATSTPVFPSIYPIFLSLSSFITLPFFLSFFRSVTLRFSFSFLSML